MPFDGSNYQDTIAARMRKRFRGGQGWCKKSLYRSDGQACLVGCYALAMRAAGLSRQLSTVDELMRHDKFRALRRAVAIVAKDEIWVAAYNDQRETTWADIERVLDEMHKEELKQRDSIVVSAAVS